jgi:hypothetical protein
MAELLCEATTGIGIGVQTFNEAALFQMGRRWFNRAVFEENVERLENRIRFVFQFIYGCPGDMYETFRDSLRWAVSSNRDVWFDRLRVLPGTIYRAKPDRFDLKFERTRPNYVLSANTFPPCDIRRAENLKRGLLLYTFRQHLRLDSLGEYLGLGKFDLLEEFGNWCELTVPSASLAFARADPVSLPAGFLGTLATWVGEFIVSKRPVNWSEYSRLRDTMTSTGPARMTAATERSPFASVRGN